MLIYKDLFCQADTPEKFRIKAEDEDDKYGYISGYASTFGNVDSVGDKVAKGAFAISLATKMPKMLWQHDRWQPIGSWTDAKEDDYGLWVQGRILKTVPQGLTAFNLLKEEAISGLSIGYRVQDYEYDNDTGIYTLKQVNLLEVSIVTFPANELAEVANVKCADFLQHDEHRNFQKSAENLLQDLRDFRKKFV